MIVKLMVEHKADGFHLSLALPNNDGCEWHLDQLLPSGAVLDIPLEADGTMSVGPITVFQENEYQSMVTTYDGPDPRRMKHARPSVFAMGAV